MASAVMTHGAQMESRDMLQSSMGLSLISLYDVNGINYLRCASMFRGVCNSRDKIFLEAV